MPKVDMISNLNVQITFRCTSQNKPYIVMIYDSRVDKFSKIKQMFPGLGTKWYNLRDYVSRHYEGVRSNQQ